MGHRANLAIVGNNDTYELFYSHWCANTLDYDVFWGPEYLERFIRIQVPGHHTEDWLDDVWAEGGVILDPVRRVLLFFGGEDIYYELPLRRAYLAMLRRVWQGWEVRWAHGHITEIAEYLAVPQQTVWSGTSVQVLDICCAPREPQWTDTIISVAERDKLLFYPLASRVSDCIDTGSGLIELVAVCKPHERLSSPFTDEYPSRLHIDIDTRTVDYCSSTPVANPIGRAVVHWPGWTVRWRRDDLEAMAPLSRGLLDYPIPCQRDLEDRIARSLLRRNPRPIDAAAIANLLSGEGARSVEITPAALRDDRLPGPDDKRAVLALALDGRDLPYD